jgi:hypothetical protein
MAGENPRPLPENSGICGCISIWPLLWLFRLVANIYYPRLETNSETTTIIRVGI